MAIMVDAQLTTLATSMVDDVMYVPPATPGTRYQVTSAGRTASIAKMKSYLGFFMTYIAGDKTKTPGTDAYKGFLEVGGSPAAGAENLTFALSNGARVIELYTAGAGSNRESPLPTDLSAATPLYPVSGSVVDSRLSTGKQTDGGRGFVK